MLQKYEAEIFNLQTKIEEKGQIDSYLEEALERMRSQLQDKDIIVNQIAKELENEKERRGREEEHSKNLMQ